MTKDEILKKAQNKSNSFDEMEIDIIQKSNTIGSIVGLVACLIMMCIKMYNNQPYQDIYSVYCVMLCGQYMYRWIRQKEKYLLLCGLLWGFTSVILFITYLMKIM